MSLARLLLELLTSTPVFQACLDHPPIKKAHISSFIQ